MQIDINSIPRKDVLFTQEELMYLNTAKGKKIICDNDSPETTPERALRFRRVSERKTVVGK